VKALAGFDYCVHLGIEQVGATPHVISPGVAEAWPKTSARAKPRWQGAPHRVRASVRWPTKHLAPPGFTRVTDLAGLDSPVPPVSGAPLRLSIDLIDKDPEQPRTEFDDESLQELAATIRERGVRQPVSVRQHPHKPGYWMLNFGARRLRASKLVG
jgi:hypothetical protein